jgi:hypothetical protein
VAEHHLPAIYEYASLTHDGGMMADVLPENWTRQSWKILI